MTNLLEPLLEGIENQLKFNDPPLILQTLNRLMDLGNSEEKAKELLCENLFIEITTVAREGIPNNKDRYIKNMMNLPTLNYDLDSAFLALDRNHWGIPFNAIEFLYNHGEDNTITDKILFSIENAYEEKVIYDEIFDCKLSFPLWYAIVAENHLSEELIDPFITLFTTIEDTWDFLDEQALFVLLKLAEKYPEATVVKVMEAIESQVKLNSEFPYHFLFDILYCDEAKKYKKRLLEILATPDICWTEPFIFLIAYHQFKEAIPLIRNIIGKSTKAEAFNRREIGSALKQLVSGENTNIKSGFDYLNNRGHWKDHYQEFENSFRYDYEEDFDESENDFIDDFDDDFPPENPKRKGPKINRNDPCYCGSGKKYKKCCLLIETLTNAEKQREYPKIFSSR